MKKQMGSILVLGMLMSFGVQAQDFHGGPDHGMRGGWMHEEEMPLPGVLFKGFEPKEGPCSQLKLDAPQKAKLKDAFFKFKESKIDLQSQMKKAHLKYAEVQFNSDSDLKSAQEASLAIVSSVTAMLQAEENYKNEVNFGILKAEQRGPAQACLMSMREFHHEHEKFVKKGHDKKDEREHGDLKK